MYVCFESVDADGGVWVVCGEDLHEVSYVRGGQPQGLDLGQLGVAGDVGNAVAE